MKLASKFIAGVALTAAAAAAQAAFVTFTSLAAFNAATSAQGTDTFNDLAITGTLSPLNRTAGSYSYVASAVGPASQVFYPAGTPADVWLSTNSAADSILFNGFAPGIRGIGGLFFGSDINGAFTAANITLDVTDASGTLTQVLVNPGISTFFGFLSDSGVTSLRVTAVQPTAGFRWPTVNNLTLAVPEPGSFALAGLALLAAVGARRRAA